MQLQLYGNYIWVYRKAVDFRKSIDGLSALINTELAGNPQKGIYLFYNRHHDRLKCLSWHKNGFLLFYKRLEKGRFEFEFNKTDGAVEINIQGLSWLLAGLPWKKMRHWSELNYDKFG
ncbi:MAG: IS66 family insertion sequence element accessory protein TnpB [Legionellales bacterium]|jgi:transposase